MNRTLAATGILGCLLAIAFALWMAQPSSPTSSAQPGLRTTLESAITNPVKFAKSHFTGGIGAALMADPVTGTPQVGQVMPGSPAEKAGLRAGDHIVAINGMTTSGRTLAQNVESIRGFVGASVTLTVQRSGSTNLQLVVNRSSWQKLGIQSPN